MYCAVPGSSNANTYGIPERKQRAAECPEGLVLLRIQPHVAWKLAVVCWFMSTGCWRFQRSFQPNDTVHQGQSGSNSVNVARDITSSPRSSSHFLRSLQVLQFLLTANRGTVTFTWVPSDDGLYGCKTISLLCHASNRYRNSTYPRRSDLSGILLRYGKR